MCHLQRENDTTKAYTIDLRMIAVKDCKDMLLSWHLHSASPEKEYEFVQDFFKMHGAI